MKNYIGNAEMQNEKYSNAIVKIKELRSLYQESIDELDSKIKNVSSVDRLKNSLISKLDELDVIIKDIGIAKTTILKTAQNLQKIEEEKNKIAELDK